ncbi:MAG: MYXO-CTERM sorting domain-containing protein [Phycisphaerales bacterium]
MKTRKNQQGCVARLAMIVAAAGGLASTAQAQDVTKTVTWTFDKAPAAGAAGKYTWDLKAQALGKAPAVLVTKTDASGAAPGIWVANAGLANTPKQTDEAVSGTAKSQAKIDFTAGAPVAGPGGTTQITTTIHINNTATAPDGRNADAWAKGTMSIPGGIVSGVVITQPGKKAVTNPKLIGGTSFGLQGSSTTWSDPLTISLFDAATNSLIHSQTIGTIDANASGTGTFLWDTTGVSLTAGNDGLSSTSISISQPAGLLTGSGFGGTVTWDGSLLTTTGLFSSLPWVVSGNSVTLAPGLLDGVSFGYSVPTSLVSAGGMYYEELDYSSAGEIHAVPTPATAVLAGLGGLVAMRRRRR